MTDSGSRRGASNFAPILMIVSFLLMIGFLVWLGMTAESTEEQVAMAEENPSAEQADSVEMGAMEVEPDSLRLSPESYVGQEVRVAAPVASAVGSEAFFLELPQSPFLVKMDSTLVASGRPAPQGDVVVTGTVLAMSDSIVTAWSEAGAISEAERPLVEFATHFIQAIRVRSEQGPGGGQAADTATGGDAQQN